MAKTAVSVAAQPIPDKTVSQERKRLRGLRNEEIIVIEAFSQVNSINDVTNGVPTNLEESVMRRKLCRM